MSDHCAIQFSLLCIAAENLPNSCEESIPQRENKKYVWKQTHAENYRNNLNAKTGTFIALKDHLIQASSPRDIDQNIDIFAEIRENVCDPLFGIHMRESNYTGSTKDAETCVTSFIVN